MFNFSSSVNFLEPFTTHKKPTLNLMVIYFIHIVPPNNAHVFPPCVQTTQHVTSFIPTYQSPPLWIVFFLTIIISPLSIFINFLIFLPYSCMNLLSQLVMPTLIHISTFSMLSFTISLNTLPSRHFFFV
jgi:hypothetical protein